jgi:hypothetical protein
MEIAGMYPSGKLANGIDENFLRLNPMIVLSSNYIIEAKAASSYFY